MAVPSGAQVVGTTELSVWVVREILVSAVLRSRRGWRAAVSGLVVIPVLVARFGLRATSGSDKFTAQMRAMCGKAHAPTSTVTPLPAGTAVAELQVAHMYTQPWDSLAPSDLIIQCGLGLPGSGSILLDGCGHHTPAPPPIIDPTCPTNVACALLSYRLFPPFHITGC